MRTVNIHICLTKRGRAALWEMGGGKTHTGTAQIVAGPDGSPKRPLFIRQSGPLALGEHALLPVAPGDFVIWARRGPARPEIEIARVESIDPGKSLAAATVVAERDNGEWSPSPPPACLDAAVRAAERKAACFHCRGPHYIKN